ncbi:MAG: allantoinase AllB [Actinomycetota bacterium]|nr:allantoinase AllB [Actinomycetota bacterium]
MRFDLILRSQHVMTDIGDRPAAVCIKDSRIAKIADFDEKLDAKEDLTLTGSLIPGLVDSHVHINEPGRTQWEGFESATKAAAAGGVTTVIDMPLNSIPPTVNVSALKTKQLAAEGKCSIDVGFWGGSIPGNVKDLEPLLEQGVFGFKCFLLHSGVDEFPASNLDDLSAALEVLVKKDALMIVHAEDSIAIQRSAKPSSRSYAEFLASRPKGAENVAVAQLIEEARRIKGRVHVLHLSSADSLTLIKSAKSDGVRITAETCPHYLSLTAEEIADGATQYKCCPPIREKRNQVELWQGLQQGIIDFIVSDHSPCTQDLKIFEIGDFQQAWGGISSLQLGISIIWSQALERGIPLWQVCTWMSAKPAELVGLKHKGSIAVGMDADLAEFDPNEEFRVEPTKLFHKNQITPYQGKVLKGRIKQTWLRGALIFKDGVMINSPQGVFLVRGKN